MFDPDLPTHTYCVQITGMPHCTTCVLGNSEVAVLGGPELFPLPFNRYRLFPLILSENSSKVSISTLIEKTKSPLTYLPTLEAKQGELSVQSRECIAPSVA